MSLADKIFIQNCKDILQHGIDMTDKVVRTHWDDGTPAYATELFGITNRYDLREEFPAITLYKTAIESAMDEILWIYQKKSNNVNDLNNHIWDVCADKTGSIGKSCGYQVGIKCHESMWTCSGDYILSHPTEFSPEVVQNVGCEYARRHSCGDKFKIEVTTRRYCDQMDGVLSDLKTNPFSHRHIISLYNVTDLPEMRLHPYCWSVNFVVTEQNGEKVLNLMLHQRYADMITANNWNVVQYALLLMMIAQSVDMIAGELVHTIANACIYDRHIPIVKELITRETYPAPLVELDPAIEDFYSFSTKDILISDYQAGEQVKNIPLVAL